MGLNVPVPLQSLKLSKVERSWLGNHQEYYRLREEVDFPAQPRLDEVNVVSWLKVQLNPRVMDCARIGF